jgi:glutamate-1-semialdehyde 2,1-aminomutase
VYQRLEVTSIYLEDGLRRAAEEAEVPVRINRAGSIMTAFFTAEPVLDYSSAKKSDTGRYASYFREMLSRGVFLAPSQYEAMFVSTVHGDGEVESTIEAARDSLISCR